MAFSFRKIISNISYFSKSAEGTIDTNALDDGSAESRQQSYFTSVPSSEKIEFDCVEADSTSRCASAKSLKTLAFKTGSLSDTDILANSLVKQKKCRKLKLDIQKANQSVSDSFIYSEDSNINVENTPKHKLLDCRSAELFRGINFNLSFDLSDAESDALSYQEENDIDIESISDTDLSATTNLDEKTVIKMCRKVEEDPIPSATPESFGDMEDDRNEDERIATLLNYQLQFEKMECFMKKVLSEFQFHIEVSKIFNNKLAMPVLPAADNEGKGEVFVDSQRGISPTWNFIAKEDCDTKNKLKTQLLSMRQTIDSFVGTYLHEPKPWKINRRVNNKKKIKHFDFPDLRDAMINLFQDTGDSVDDNDCNCRCHSADSGLNTKSEKDSNQTNHSITSSIGNFSLDSTTLSAYSESLDQVISYNSFDESSLFSTLMQEAAIERITFYIQVHSIQLNCETTTEFESKNTITFHCPTCNTTEYEENGLLKHILSPLHCEKIHFVYKTAYVKKCFTTGKEIQPSTVLNPMTMYRDENKIVCFGDAMYACSLCFENLIVGESVLMAHCSQEEHVHRRGRLPEIFE